MISVVISLALVALFVFLAIRGTARGMSAFLAAIFLITAIFAYMLSAPPASAQRVPDLIPQWMIILFGGMGLGFFSALLFVVVIARYFVILRRIARANQNLAPAAQQQQMPNNDVVALLLIGFATLFLGLASLGLFNWSVGLNTILSR